MKLLNLILTTVTGLSVVFADSTLDTADLNVASTHGSLQKRSPHVMSVICDKISIPIHMLQADWKNQAYCKQLWGNNGRHLGARCERMVRNWKIKNPSSPINNPKYTVFSVYMTVLDTTMIHTPPGFHGELLIESITWDGDYYDADAGADATASGKCEWHS